MGYTRDSGGWRQRARLTALSTGPRLSSLCEKAACYAMLAGLGGCAEALRVDQACDILIRALALP